MLPLAGPPAPLEGLRKAGALDGLRKEFAAPPAPAAGLGLLKGVDIFGAVTGIDSGLDSSVRCSPQICASGIK